MLQWQKYLNIVMISVGFMILISADFNRKEEHKRKNPPVMIAPKKDGDFPDVYKKSPY